MVLLKLCILICCVDLSTARQPETASARVLYSELNASRVRLYSTYSPTIVNRAAYSLSDRPLLGL